VDSQSLKNQTSDTAVSFVLFEGDSGDKASEQAKKAFERVAYQVQGVHKFLRAKAKDLKLNKRFSVDDDERPVVVCHMEGGFDDKFTGPWLETGLRAFVDAHKLPLVSDLDSTNFEDVTSTGQIVVFATSDPAASSTKQFMKALVAVARKYRQFTFANVDGVKFAKYVGQFGVQQNQLPTVFALNYTGDQYYLADVPSSSESQIEAFVHGILTGNIPARETSSWYSPWRYYKYFEKWLGTFSEGQLAFATITAMLLFAVIIFAGCYYAAQDLIGEDPSAKKDGTATSVDGKASKALENKSDSKAVTSGASRKGPANKKRD
jgi:thioredoxin-like negative regulator of GroEL